MKRLIAILISCSVILSGCQSSSPSSLATSNSIQVDSEVVSEVSSSSTDGIVQTKEGYSGLDDPRLADSIESGVYNQLLEELGEDYFIENVDTVYLSKEYIETVESNSKSNIYFGCTLEELDQVFEGKRYVFTLGEDGQTVVQELVEVTPDNTFSRVMRNVLIGTGVILVCVTISAITYTTAPAVSVIFAASAKGGSFMALETGTISFLTSSIATYCETGDWNEALKTGAVSGSEGYLFGAIVGSIAGGANQYHSLKGIKKETELSLNDIAIIQRETKWSPNVIKRIGSKEEYEVYSKAGLFTKSIELDNSEVLLRDIDWNYVDEMGRTNLQRAKLGLSPLDPSGVPYELHHVGQKADSPLAVLTREEHHANDSILHDKSKSKGISDEEFAKQRKKIWKAVAKLVE